MSTPAVVERYPMNPISSRQSYIFTSEPGFRNFRSSSKLVFRWPTPISLMMSRSPFHMGFEAHVGPVKVQCGRGTMGWSEAK